MTDLKPFTRQGYNSKVGQKIMRKMTGIFCYYEKRRSHLENMKQVSGLDKIQAINMVLMCTSSGLIELLLGNHEAYTVNSQKELISIHVVRNGSVQGYSENILRQRNFASEKTGNYSLFSEHILQIRSTAYHPQ